MTYSILGRDAFNGDLGVAVQSKFPGVGSLVPYGEAEVGWSPHRDSAIPDMDLPDWGC